MSQVVRGNTKGLAPSQLRSVERLFARSVSAGELVSIDLAREIYRVASAIKRRVGLLVSREGRVEEVFVGSREILYLPDLGRYRFGRGRLRRLRLIFSDLSKSYETPHIPGDIYTDLQKLRLDTVIAVRAIENSVQLSYAYIVPPGLDVAPMTRTEVVGNLDRFELDYGNFMAELENELQAAQESSAKVEGARAVLIGVYESRRSDPESSMTELKELARTAGVSVVETIVQRRNPDPRTLLGKGKLEQVVLRCLALSADILIFDAELKPGQWRVITNLTELKVIDRSMLILDIFAQRASSSEGRLQVELAQLKYNLPRLVEKDTGLSRLSGGIGGRGPGETKLEIGRRRIRDRISDLEKRIDALSSQRGLRRQKRQAQGISQVAILGYTNVGKSTLFNALTKSNVIAENKLFATLDPAQRRVTLQRVYDDRAPDLIPVVMSDTVGFIRELPEELKNAFRATLEELYEAQVLVHVLDASDPDIFTKKAAVDATLEEMELTGRGEILVLNKIDALAENNWRALAQQLGAVPVSAKDRVGFELLRAEILKRLRPVAETEHKPLGAH